MKISRKPDLLVSAIDCPDVMFQAVPAGESVVLFARMSKERFEQICAAGSDLEDFEPDEDIEDFEDGVEAEETSDGFSA